MFSHSANLNIGGNRQHEYGGISGAPRSGRVGSANAGTLPLARNCCETTNRDGIQLIQFENDDLATMEIVMNAIHLQNHKVPMIPRLTWDEIDMRIGHDDARAKGIFWIDFPGPILFRVQSERRQCERLVVRSSKWRRGMENPPSKRIGVFTKFRCALLTRSFLPGSLSATAR